MPTEYLSSDALGFDTRPSSPESVYPRKRTTDFVSPSAAPTSGSDASDRHRGGNGNTPEASPSFPTPAASENVERAIGSTGIFMEAFLAARNSNKASSSSIPPCSTTGPTTQLPTVDDSVEQANSFGSRALQVHKDPSFEAPITPRSLDSPRSPPLRTIDLPPGKVDLPVKIQTSLDTYLRTQSQLKDSSPAVERRLSLNKAAEADRLRLSTLSPLDSTRDVTDDPAKNIFLFVNPTSGGNAAASFMEAGLEYIRLSCPEPVNLWIWDIRQGESGAKPGFLKLRRVAENLSRRKRLIPGISPACGDYVYMIICGGDGTVMWGVTELWAHGIRDEDIALGVVPYGTGNDFARALGWQKYNAAKPYENKFKGLKALVRDWLAATVVYHDIWELTFRVFPSGSFQKIDSETRKKKNVAGVRPQIGSRTLSQSISILADQGRAETDLKNMSARVLTLKMCNYFSFGVESRVGVGFDRYRTTSQFWNKVRYGLEGGKKAFFRNVTPLYNTIDSLSSRAPVGTGPTGDEGETIYFSNSPDSPCVLMKNTRCLIASNIPSFAAGLDIWRPSKKGGIIQNDHVVLRADERDHVQQLGDGNLEFMAFKGITALGVERAFHGNGRRICHGPGPFILTFKDAPANQRSYFQVDGEFFIMSKPEK